MKRRGAIANVIASERAHELISARKRATARREGRGIDGGWRTAKSAPPSAALTASRWRKNVTIHRTTRSAGGPGTGAGSRAGIRSARTGRLRGLHRPGGLQRAEVGDEGLQLLVGPDERRHERVVRLLGRGGGPLRPVVAQRRQEERQVIRVGGGRPTADREGAVERVAGGALGAEDGPALRHRIVPRLVRRPAGLRENALAVELLDLGNEDPVREHVAPHDEGLARPLADPLVPAEEAEGRHEREDRLRPADAPRSERREQGEQDRGSEGEEEVPPARRERC